MQEHSLEVAKGGRFEFGKNWSAFLSHLNQERILQAEESLKKMLGMEDLRQKRLLDIGAGSGLFSLCARRLGASVFSIDYDPQSVACTRELKRCHFDGDPEWIIEEGSALDSDYIESLGKFDVVYSWGVLHHTGNMWRALENAGMPVAEGGLLFISIYNDQGGASKRWRMIKRTYNRLPKPLKMAFVLVIMGPLEVRMAIYSLLRLRPLNYIHSWTRYKTNRGMSRWHDLIDWVGGYPFEVAKPEDIFSFYQKKGFALRRLKTCGGGLGCNEFVFQRVKISWPSSALAY